MLRLYPLGFAAAMFGIALNASAALAQAYPPGPPHPPGPPPGPGYNHPPGPPPPPGPGYNHPPGPPPGAGYHPPPPVMGYNHPPGPPPGYNHPPEPPPGGWHQWHQGDHYSGNRVVVNNYSYYRLRPPPPGYQWVQDGSQFVLVAVASGIIADVILNAASQ